MSLETQIANLVAATNQLTGEVSGKMAAIDAKTNQQAATFQAWQGQFALRAQQNLLRDSGRFFDPDVAENSSGSRNIYCGAGFAFAGSEAVLYNGTTVANAGKFTHNNSTNGGGGAALPDRVKSLTDRMHGVGNSRHGVEFYVAELTMAANPTQYAIAFPDGVTRYLATTRTIPVPIGTQLVWLMAVSGSVGMTNSPLRNGVQTGDGVVRPADGWVHLAAVSDGRPGGYVMPGLHAEAGTVFCVALPAVVAGDVTGLVHGSPILTQHH